MIRSFLITLAFFAVTASTVSAKITNDDLQLAPKSQTIQIADLIDEIFSTAEGFTASDRQTIKRIADCESGGKVRGGPNGLIMHLQPNGKLTINTSSQAAGAMQILRENHSKHFWARNKLDPKQVYENLLYARALMHDRIERQGRSYRFADWLASKPCWNKDTHTAYN